MPWAQVRFVPKACCSRVSNSQDEEFLGPHADRIKSRALRIAAGSYVFLVVFTVMLPSTKSS